MSMPSNVKFIITTVFIIVETIAIIPCLFGNFVVINVMSREKNLLRKSNFHILSVAVADFLMGLIGIPMVLGIRIYRGNESQNLCLGIISFLLFLYAVSTFSLVAVSFDRYLAIAHPIFYRNRVTVKMTIIAIVICWTLGLIGTFPFFWWNSGLFEGRCHTRIILSFSYLKFICIFGSFIPTIIIIVFYTLIYKEIKKIRASKASSNADNSNSKREEKAAKTLLIIIVSFLVSWVPLTMMFFYFAVKEDRSFPEEILDIFVILSHFNPAIDAIVYAYQIRDVRESMKRFVMLGYRNRKERFQSSATDKTINAADSQ